MPAADPTEWRPDFPDSRVSVHADLDPSVEVGTGTVIYGGVKLGAGSVIDEYCVLGGGPDKGRKPLEIGPGARIRSHSVVYAGSGYGAGLETGHHVVLREQTRAGLNLRVGNFSDIEGRCSIGDYCRFHGYVHVGSGTTVGNFVWLFSLTTCTNDPLPPSSMSRPVTVGDGAVVCVGVTLMPGTVIGKGAFLAAGSYAAGEIPPGAVVSGAEGVIVNHVSRLLHMESGQRHPWMRHYDKGFPPEVRPRLDALMEEIMANRTTLETGRR